MFPRWRLNSKWPLKRGRAAYIAGKEVQLGVVGARGRLELLRRERCRAGSGLSQDGANQGLFSSPTDQLLPPLYIPPVSDGVRAISWSARIQWSAGEQAHNVQKLHEKCAQDAQNLYGCCTMTGTHRSRMGRSVRAHIVVFSRLANSTSLCVYHISITIQL